MAHAVKKIISGGQTGADQGGLAAAKHLHLATGGYMPRGFRTEAGPRPDMHHLYGMYEHTSSSYMPRTRLNVVNSHGTFIFGDPTSAGSRLTIETCQIYKRPFYVVRWPELVIDKEMFLQWLKTYMIEILNVAGNREEKRPGIHQACRSFLVAALEKTSTS